MKLNGWLQYMAAGSHLGFGATRSRSIRSAVPKTLQ